MFKVNNKNSRTMSKIFHTFSSVSIVEFEQVNVSWIPCMVRVAYLTD